MTNKLKKILNTFVFHSLFQKDWDDLIFHQRNKEYGAYTLRRVFARNQVIGLTTTVIVFTLFILWVFLKTEDKKSIKFEFEEMIEYKGFDANLLSVRPLEKDQKKEEPKKEDIKPEEKVNKDLPPEVKEDVPLQKTELATKIDSVAKKIDSTGGNNDKKNVTASDTGITKDVYTEGPASPYGGLVEFQKWVQAHIVKPQAAKDAGITGTIFVSFTVDKEGNIKNVKLLKGFGYGCDEEVVRVVSIAPKWKPLVRAGFAVESRFSFPVAIH